MLVATRCRYRPAETGDRFCLLTSSPRFCGPGFRRPPTLFLLLLPPSAPPLPLSHSKWLMLSILLVLFVLVLVLVMMTKATMSHLLP